MQAALEKVFGSVLSTPICSFLHAQSACFLPANAGHS